MSDDFLPNVQEGNSLKVKVHGLSKYGIPSCTYRDRGQVSIGQAVNNFSV